MPRKPLFKSKIEEWIKELEDTSLSSSTIYIYESRLRNVLEYAMEHDWPMNPKKVTGRDMRGLYEHLQVQSTSTQANYLNTALAFLRACGNENVKDLNFRIKVARTRVNWISEEEVALLLSSTTYPEQKAMIVLMAYCGLRVGEVISLRAKDLKDSELLVRGKGGKSRAIPIDREFWEAMDDYFLKRRKISHDTFLVHDHHGVIVPYKGLAVQRSAKTLGRRFGLHTPPHTFRRSFGRHLYKRGCPLAELAYLMGHSVVETTVSYLGIGKADIEQAMTAFRPSYVQIAQKLYLQRESQATPALNFGI